jgi:integrating conjugative element protein (TIGR03746 family)
MSTSRFMNALDGVNFTIRVQWVFIAILCFFLLFAMMGWKNAPKHLTAHIPPDLRSGATLNIGTTPDVPPPNVYAFAHYVWQQVNRWKEDGTKNYGEQIFAMQNYITPACREQLVADMNIKAARGELALRTRSIMEIPGQSYVEKRVVPLGSQAWTVLLDMQVQENSRGMEVKDAFIRYPMQVVRFDVDREKNPFGLAIDCFGNNRPERLDPKNYKMLTAPKPSTGPAPAVLPQAVAQQ